MIIYNNDFFQCDRFFSFKFQFHEKTSTVLSDKKNESSNLKKLKITKKRILTVKNEKIEFHMLGQPKNN